MNPITQGLGDFFTNLISGLATNLSTAIGPLINLIGNTPLALTTGNPVVNGAWLVMVGVTDAFLGLYVIMKLIQMMHSEATGTVSMPIGQFVPKVILTVILIHASSFVGQELLLLTNALCGVVTTNAQSLVRQVNNGHLLSGGQSVGLSAVLTLIASFSLFRVIFQACKRVAFFNVLFVLSGPALLMSLDTQTAPWFQFWGRTYMVTILSQFFQFLTFWLGIEFLLSTNVQKGLTTFVLAMVVLNLTAEIPSLLARFASSAGASAPGVGALVRGAFNAAMLFM